MVGILMAADRT